MKTDKTSKPAPPLVPLEKTPSGVAGLDEITGGGLPKGRPTLICGAAGCGKTLLGMEFLVRGATQYGEPGVFMAFEETEDELAKNVASLGFDLKQLAARKKILLDYVRIERSEIEETGEYDLEGLFVRLNLAIDSIGAKRVVLDSLEALFAGLPNEMILRAELRRLFRWLKDKGVTAVITAERGRETLTRHGLEEYVADCVILLDHRVSHDISTRRLRVVKYRGSLHGTNEYPFLIGPGGVSVLPVSSMRLEHIASTRRLATGIPRLDAMLGGRGFFRGSSILVSGASGTGKTSIGASFVAAAARRGEKALFFAFEESPSQIMRNMRSIGLDLEPWIQKGLLRFHAARPSLHGLEMHLLTIVDLVNEFKPRVVVIDPITNLLTTAEEMEVRSMLTRLVDWLKQKQTTAIFTSLTSAANVAEQSEVGISSIMDTWLLVRNLENGGERNRALYILKSRGMAHSNQVREFVLSDNGISLVDVYVGAGTVLTGSARLAQEAREKAEGVAHQEQSEQHRRQIERECRAAEAQIEDLRASLEAKRAELAKEQDEEALRDKIFLQSRQAMATLRRADTIGIPKSRQNH